MVKARQLCTVGDTLRYCINIASGSEANITTLGCPTTYSCHVDSVLLDSKFEANTETQSSNILRSNIRTYLEGHGVFR